jgi:hypothetical protein
MLRQQRIEKEKMDLEMGQLKVKKPFARDDFRQLINKTYMAFYGKFKD